MKTYAEKLKDPRWQRKRLEIMERDRFQCQSCGDGTKNLQIHHCFYLPKRNPWDYPDESLVTLCENCHKEQTDRLPGLLILNKTPEFTMLNTELIKNAKASAESHDLTHEVAYGVSLLNSRDFDHALEVLKFSAEILRKIISDIETKPRHLSVFEQLIAEAPEL